MSPLAGVEKKLSGVQMSNKTLTYTHAESFLVLSVELKVFFYICLWMVNIFYLAAFPD